MEVLDMTIPRSFREEFDEVAQDVIFDFDTTFEEVDREVGRKLEQMIVDTITRLGHKPDALIRFLASLLMYMFLIGREHAARGYTSPIERGPGENYLYDQVPDDPSEL